MQAPCTALQMPWTAHRRCAAITTELTNVTSMNERNAAACICMWHLVIGVSLMHISIQHDAGVRDRHTAAIAELEAEVTGEASRQDAPDAISVQLKGPANLQCAMMWQCQQQQQQQQQ